MQLHVGNMKQTLHLRMGDLRCALTECARCVAHTVFLIHAHTAHPAPRGVAGDLKPFVAMFLALLMQADVRAHGARDHVCARDGL